MDALEDAFNIFNAIEYNSHGDMVKRCPDEAEYNKALETLRAVVHGGGDNVLVSRYNFQVLMAAYRAAPRPIPGLQHMDDDDCETAFWREMEGRQYGPEETADAKAWFTSGYNSCATTPNK
jgi:hypothetical protein